MEHFINQLQLAIEVTFGFEVGEAIKAYFFIKKKSLQWIKDSISSGNPMDYVCES